MAEVVADKGEVGFFGFYIFNSADVLDGFLLEYIAPKSIDGIGGVYDGSAVLEALDDLSYFAGFGIEGMNS